MTLVLTFLSFVTGLWQNKACWTGVTRCKRAVSRHFKGTPVGQKCFKRFFYRDFLSILYPAFVIYISERREWKRIDKMGYLFQLWMRFNNGLNYAVKNVNGKKTYCRACRAFLLILFPFGRLPVSALKEMKNKTKCRHYIDVLTAKEVNNLLILQLS